MIPLNINLGARRCDFALAFSAVAFIMAQSRKPF
jgi:hypothetical protein